MTKKFTSSEVRATIAKNWDGVTDRKMEMLHAFADRLEADEKAVPVLYQSTMRGVMWVTESKVTADLWAKEGSELKPLYTHPAPAYAERLAEALRQAMQSLRTIERGAMREEGLEEAENVRAYARSRAGVAESALAARSAQAQSQAASGPEVESLRAFSRDVLRAWPDGGIDGDDLQDLALKHGLLEPSVPTQEERDEWGLDDGDDWYRRTALIAAQESPNG